MLACGRKVARNVMENCPSILSVCMRVIGRRRGLLVWEYVRQQMSSRRARGSVRRRTWAEL